MDHKELAANTTLSHYRIVSKIGAGGMGEVYLAQDTKLDRKVALKILPADLAANQDRMRRFVQEAKAAAALNHPNIAHIYEIGESDGTHYIAMEFVDGQTLREKIYRDGASLPKLLKYLTQVALGLTKAHAAGIVHRDLKPDNIMITRDDYAKVLDFGLAKLVEPQKSFGSSQSSSSEIATAIMQQQSIAGMVMGTIGYMSPEQASGRVHEIDHRSDIFSFGCILFEAATGQKAFEGKDALDSLHKIVHAPTPQLKDVNPLAPDDLQRVVRRCLAKEADKRYQSMKEVAIEIDDLQQELKSHTGLEYVSQRTSSTSATTSGAERSDERFWVAVLPFKHQGAEPGLEALTEGINEGIINGLSRFSYLRVIARGSTARFSSESGDIRAIGKELGARYVMEGSIRQAGATVRLAVQLVDAITGAHLWAETYNRDLKESDIFTVQDDMTDRVVATVADSYGVLVRSMAASVEEKPEAELTASDWVLRQFRYRQQLTPEEHAKVRDGLERFVERESKHAALWACLAQLYVDEFVFGFNSRPDSLDRALAAARRSVDLDRTFQYGNQILAQVHFFRRDIPAFRTAAEQAMALNSRDTDTLAMMGLMLVHIGEFERGANIVRRAMDLNPSHAGWYHFALIWEYLHKGDYEKALAQVTRVNMPGLFWQPLAVASCCGLLGRQAEAAAAVQELHKLDKDFELHAREYIECWHYSSGLMDRILEGLSKAGLEVAGDSGTPGPSPAGTASGETPALEGFWVAVLPFKYRGSNVDIEALAEGLSEDIVTGLSRFSYLRVIARGSTLRFTSEGADVHTVGKELGARYIMEGSLRVAGSVLRVSVQLVDSTSGSHIWAETYNRSFTPEELFALQDDLVPVIVSTVADMHGVLPRSMSEVVRLKSADQISPYEALLYSFGYNERVTPEALAEARTCLERAVEQAPGNADCWAMLSLMYSNEYGHWHIHKPDSAEKAMRAARTAVQAAPLHSLPYYALAQALFFQKEIPAFRVAAERAVSLSPMNGATAAFMGLLIAYSGDWERGCALAERGLQLNPNQPGWYCYTALHDAYRRKDYRTALDLALKLNAPDNFYTHAWLAMCNAQLGQIEAARKAVRDLLALKPAYPQIARQLHAKWIQPDLVEELMDGLRKAGLEIADEEGLSTATPSSSPSSEMRSDEGFWVAVLPFKSSGTNLEVTTLAEGLSEEIVTGLSQFSYLRVIARSSTSRFASETTDVRSVGKQVGARYVMEGSLRQAGSTLRVAVHLVDASTGATLWAETYNRTFSPETVFELQDDLVPRIVSTVADMHGVLPRSMSEAVRNRTPEQLTPYEAVLRGFGFFERVSPGELAEARAALELAVRRAPTYADAWAMLALICVMDYAEGFNLQADSLTSGALAAQRAVEAGPSNNLAYSSLAQALFFQKEFLSFRNAAERAIALNPMDASMIAFLGVTLAYVGEWERGCALAERAMQLNPNHPGWYRYAAFFNAYRQGDYRGALDVAIKIMPRYFWSHAVVAAAAGQLGDLETARTALREILAEKPDFGRNAREEFLKWNDPELVEHVLDGLRKAGLEIPDEPSSSTILRKTRSSPSIAVLPFVNISNDPDNDYFCDGLAEELLNALSKVGDLKVAARTSAFSFKGKNANVSEIGQKLNVKTVLEGSVRKSGDRLRISVQLISVSDGFQLWSERYDLELRDVFDVQDEITLSVIDALRLKLFGDEKVAVLKRYTNDAKVHELFLKGRYHAYKYTAEGWKRAIEFFEQAIEKQPNYAPAYAGMAAARGCLWFFGLLPAGQTIPQCKTAAKKALEIDENLADAYLSQGIITFFYDWEWEKAEQEFKRSISLNPNSAEALSYYAMFLGFEERFDEAISCGKRSLEIDPLSPLINMNVGWTYFSAGLFAEALDQAGKMIEIEPDFYGAYWLKGAIYLSQGEYEEAVEELKKAVTLGGHQIVLADLGSAYGLAGKQDKAAVVLDQLLEMRQQQYVPAICMARIYSRIGENNEAIEWLEKAFEERNGEMVFLKGEIAGAADGDSLNSLGSDPKVIDLLRRMNLP